MPGFLSRFTNRGAGNAVLADLKKVTESGVIEIPQALLEPVLEAARGEDDRREIMRHLQSCLGEPSGKKWKRVHAGLVLAEALVTKGPQELLVETAQGMHFDLVMRLSLLERFELDTDSRVQNTVRAKAKALRAEVVPRLQEMSSLAMCPEGSCKDTASTGSGGGPISSALSSVGSAGGGGMVGFGSDSEAPGATPTESLPTGFGSESLPEQFQKSPVGQRVLNGLVVAGHHDDTTSESDGGDGARGVQYRTGGQKRTKKKTTRRRHDDTDSDSSGCARAPPRAPAPRAPLAAAAPVTAQPMVDLLDL